MLDFDTIEAEQETIPVRAKLDGVTREWELRADADTLLGLRAVRLFDMSAQLQAALEDDADDGTLEELLTKLESRTLALVSALFVRSGYAEMDEAAVRRALPRHEMRWAVLRAFFTRPTASSSTPPPVGPLQPRQPRQGAATATQQPERPVLASTAVASTAVANTGKSHRRRRRADPATRMLTGKRS